MELNDFFDQLIKNQRLKNDKGLANFLGKAPNTISQYRSGHRLMDEETALTIADHLGMDDARPILAARKIAYAEKHGQETLWRGFMQRAAKATATAALSCILPFNVQNVAVKNFLTLPDTPTLENQQVKSDQKTDNLYIM